MSILIEIKHKADQVNVKKFMKANNIPFDIVSREQFDELPPGSIHCLADDAPPALDLGQINQVFAKLVEHDQKHSNNGYDKHVIGADLALSLSNVEDQLLSLIYNMYELAHAKPKEVPKPPEYDLVDYDCDGTWVGDLIVTNKAIAASPRHENVEVRDYLAQGWKRDQLLSHGYCKLKPMQAAPAPMSQPPVMPTMQPEPQPELVIGKLLLDLKDGNLPPTVEPLVQLLANLEGGE